MTKHKNKPTREELHRLYVDEFKTLKQIAAIYECCPQLVSNWMKSFDIRRRSLRDAQLKGKDVPTNDELYALYIDDMQSRVVIGTKYGVSEGAVKRWLDKAGIQRRTQSEAGLLGKYLPDEDELYKLYVVDMLSVFDVATRFGVGKSTVRRLLDRYGIPKRGMSEVKLHGVQLPDARTIIDMYEVQYMSAPDIAKMFGVVHSTITNMITSNGGTMRNTRECNMAGRYIPNNHELHVLYINERKTLKDIGKMFGVYDSTVTNWLRSANIQIRSLSDAQLRGKHIPAKEELYKLYVTENKSSYDIGNMFGVSGNAILDHLRAAGIHVRTGDERVGELSPGWKGGISKLPYCNKWTDEIREHIREKFNRRCFLCGKTEVDNGQRLDVHHTNSGKMCMCDYSCELVPLCKSCHAKTIHHRFYWYSVIMVKIHLESSADYMNIVVQV